MGGVWVQLLEVQGACVRIIFVLRECIWNTPAVLLVLSAFDDNGSLGNPPCQMVYPPGFTLGDCLSFICGEWGG